MDFVTSTASTPRPRFLFLAAAILVIEALLMLALGVLEATAIRPSRLVLGVGTTVLALAYAAFLAATGRGVLLGRRWSRGPAVATQLIHLPVGWSYKSDPTTAYAWALIAASVIALVCLLLPASTAIFTEEKADHDTDAGPDDVSGPAATR